MSAEMTLQIGDTFEVLQENWKVLQIGVGTVPFQPGLGGCRGLGQRWTVVWVAKGEKRGDSRAMAGLRLWKA